MLLADGSPLAGAIVVAYSDRTATAQQPHRDRTARQTTADLPFPVSVSRFHREVRETESPGTRWGRALGPPHSVRAPR